MNLFFIIYIIVLFHLWCVVCDTTPPSREDLECAVCVLLIEELEGLASEVKSQEQIEQEIRNRICARLSGTLRQGCDTFVRFIPDLLSFLNNGVRPAQTCKTLQLCKQNWGELPPDGRPVNVYSIDLNQPAKTRWQAIVQRQPYFDNLWKLHYTLIELLHSEYVELLYGLGKQIFEIVPQPFKDELQGIADTTKLDIGFLVLLNLFYELKNGCTSVVAKDKQNQVFFSRNQDLGYGMGFTDLLRNQTIHVKFTRGKQVVHEIVTFAGYIGAPTGWLKDHFSIAVNARFYRGSIFTYIESVLEELLLKKAHINTWVVREALMEQDNFESAVKRFSNTTLITDCYFIIGGVKNNEGVVIARDQEGPVYTRHLDDKQNWFLLETNYDQNEKPPFYDDRRPYALAAMHKYCNNGTDVTLNCLYQTLSTHPVLNLVSLYTAQAEANGLSVHHRTCHRRPGTANPDCVI